MKRIATIISIVMMFVSVSAFASREPVVDEERISEVITDCYPWLKDYYEAGVMEVGSLTEETLSDGCVEYNIKYKFTRCFYEGKELMDVLKEKYPDVYIMKRAGLVKDVVVYRFVDHRTGEIATEVAYNRVERPHVFFRLW